MRYLVISDTHGSIDAAVSVGRACIDEAPLQGLIHAGDGADDAPLIAHKLGIACMTVAGNMDFFSQAPKRRFWETPYGRILLTHGHRFGVKRGLDRLIASALEWECKAAIFGHTHQPHVSCTQGVNLLNPGSLTHPFSGMPSYAMLEIGVDTFRASVLFWEGER